MKKIIFVSTIILSFLLLSGQGCGGAKKVGPPDAAVWTSFDKGETWQQSALMPTLQGVRSLGDLSTNLLVFDPQDPETIYWGAAGAGLLVSYDSGRSWQDVKKLPKTQINALSVDPKAKNIVYASTGNRIFKTTDCGREWKDIYIDSAGTSINALAVDLADSSIILAGLVDGRLIKSADRGLNWSLFYTFKTAINSIFYNQRDPKIIYIGMSREGIFRSEDNGSTWTQNEALQKISGGNNFHYGFFDETRRDTLHILTDAGFLRSDEGANSWQEYKLLTPPGRVRTLAFTANPRNPNEIYYMTETTFYKSDNGGVTWVTKKLPTTSLPVYLTTHPQNPNILYMGARRIERK